MSKTPTPTPNEIRQTAHRATFRTVLSEARDAVAEVTNRLDRFATNGDPDQADIECVRSIAARVARINAEDRF